MDLYEIAKRAFGWPYAVASVPLAVIALVGLIIAGEQESQRAPMVEYQQAIARAQQESVTDEKWKWEMCAWESLAAVGKSRDRSCTPVHFDRFDTDGIVITVWDGFGDLYSTWSWDKRMSPHHGTWVKNKVKVVTDNDTGPFVLTPDPSSNPRLPRSFSGEMNRKNGGNPLFLQVTRTN